MRIKFDAAHHKFPFFVQAGKSGIVPSNFRPISCISPAHVGAERRAGERNRPKSANTSPSQCFAPRILWPAPGAPVPISFPKGNGAPGGARALARRPSSEPCDRPAYAPDSKQDANPAPRRESLAIGTLRLPALHRGSSRTVRIRKCHRSRRGGIMQQWLVNAAEVRNSFLAIALHHEHGLERPLCAGSRRRAA